jgi:hypothetical protein
MPMPKYNTYTYPNNWGPLYSNGVQTTINSPFNPPAGSTLTSTIGGSSFDTSSVNCFYSNTSSVSMDSLNISTTSFNAVEPNTLETGRISGGTASSQSFETVYGDFNSYTFQTISMKLLPESQKPVEASEIRNYCPNCRTRIKKASWKFCPSCGEKF